eukprot:2599416-Rhodomonas_salina.1
MPRAQKRRMSRAHIRRMSRTHIRRMSRAHIRWMSRAHTRRSTYKAGAALTQKVCRLPAKTELQSYDIRLVNGRGVGEWSCCVSHTPVLRQYCTCRTAHVCGPPYACVSTTRAVLCAYAVTSGPPYAHVSTTCAVLRARWQLLPAKSNLTQTLNPKP